MRKLSRTAAAGVAALFVLSIPGTAQADPGGARPGQPVSPPGYVISEADRPDQACDALIGRSNRYEKQDCVNPG